MKRLLQSVIAAGLISSISTAQYVTPETVAFWDFENSTETMSPPYDGQPFNSSSSPDGTHGTADEASNLIMLGMNEYSGPYFTSENVDSGYAMGCDAHNGGYVADAAFNTFAPEQWTIEAKVWLDALGGWGTFIGKDGSYDGGPLSDFYFQKMGDGSGRIRGYFATASGERIDIPSSTVMEVNSWYGIAIASDGTNAYLYIDSGSGYQLENTYTYSNGGSDIADNILMGAENEWVFGRGWYVNPTDHIDGRIDNVRFSSACLKPSDLIVVSVFSFINHAPVGTTGSTPSIEASWVELGSKIFSNAVLYLDGTAVATNDTRTGTTNAISYEVTSSLPDGTHKCEVVLTDTLGDTWSKTWSFTVWDDAPAFRLISRAPAAASDDLPVIEARWEEVMSTFSSAVLYLDGLAVATSNTRVGAINTISYAAASPLSDGAHDCEVIVMDTLGATWSSAWTFMVLDGVIDGEVKVEPPGPCSRKTGFAITEIMHTPDDAATTNTEFVEIYNSNPFEEELSGYRLSGEIDFTFPEGTFLAGESYLIVAKNAAGFQTRYSLSGVQIFEYGALDGSNSLGKSGPLRLINNSGGIILEVDYDNDVPWPIGAGATGHSLVMVRPSYGENDPQAWAISDVIGGSPGTAESYSASALRKVCINELLAHTDDPQLDSIELYNHSASSVDISGCYLSDDPATNNFIIPAGTILPAGGYIVFDQNQLGFSLNAAGESIYFRDSTSTYMLDAVKFDGQENGVSIGRFPDGGKEFYRMTSLTLGSANAARRIDDMVINEIMYDPISGDKDDEFVELYNQGSYAIDLSGWKLNGGIGFTFPDGATIPANGYVVVGNDAIRLQTNYAQLNASNTFGNYSGSLANGGDRILLTKPDTVVDYTIPGHPVTNRIDIVVDEVTYKTGGQWPVWANGGGSSMERVDPWANPRFPTAWADSDESAKAAWTDISVTGLLELGSGTAYAVEGGLMGAGECLLDNVQVVYSGSDRMLNSDFNGGLNDWVARGAYERSELDAGGYGGTQCLHVRASKRCDTGANRIMGWFSSNLSSGNFATINAKARWLKGDPHLLLRIHGNWLEAPATLNVPSNLGTPGQANSRATANAAPDIDNVMHSPIMPAAGEPVVVTANVEDPDGLTSVVLRYRVDPASTYSSVVMNDGGTAGDSVAGDGVYSAMIPGQTAGTMVAFKVEAADGAGSPTRVFPGNTPDNYPRERECLVRFGDTTRSSSFGSYRMWFTGAAVSDWENRLVLSNEPIEGTFVHNDCRVIYNFSARYTGSYYHQWWTSPLSDCNYSMEMPLDDMLLGTDNFNKLHAPGNNVFEDWTFQREQTVYWMSRQMGLPWLYRRYVNVYVNGVPRKSGWLMEDAQVPGDDFVESYWPKDADGELYKFSFWMEADDAASGALGPSWGWKQGDLQLLPYLNAAGNLHPARQRWTWARRAYGTTGGYDRQSVFELIEAANAGSTMTDDLLAEADIEQWMRTLAVRHAAGDWDSYACGPNGQNMYAYKPEAGRWQFINWDAQILLGLGGYLPGRELFPVVADFAGDSTLTAIYNNPTFRRMYLRSLKELCTEVLQPGKYNPLLTAKYNAFIADGLNAQSPDAVFSMSGGGGYDGEPSGSFNGSLRDFLAAVQTEVLARVALQDVSAFILTSANSITTSSNLVTITGRAPVEMTSITVNGVPYPLSWSTPTDWSIQVVVNQSGVLNIQGLDIDGSPLIGFDTTVTVNLTGSVDAPEDSVVINEIRYNAAETGTEFIELHNRSTNTSFNLYEWRVNGLDHTFASTLLRPGEYLVVDQFNGRLDLDGETLTLLRPVGTNGIESVVDRVHYETVDPWPSTPAGSSLQLMDAAQDNRRAALWATVDGSAPPPVGQTIIDWSADWKYRQGVSLDGTGWYLPSYNDISWPYGPGALGVEGSALPHPIQTSLTLGNLTYYFRKTFSFAGQGGAAIQLTTMIDDGAVVYLDGVEIYRLRMPGGTPTYSTLASSAVGNAAEENSPILLVNLQPGAHVLAVEVHQTSSGSSDIVFDMRVDTDYSDYSGAAPATPGYANSVAYTKPVIPAIWLNEVMPLSLSDVPWVELYNAGDTPVDVGGYHLSNDYGDPQKWTIPGGTTIAPGAFLKITVGSGSLTNNGSVLLSRDVGGVPEVIDYLNYGDLAVGWSYGNYPDGEPCYRIPMYSATPGTANTNLAAPIEVRINEWMADNTYTLSDSVDGNYEDWFELYNPGDDPVDIGGYYLTDDLADPFQFEVPTGGKYTIPAHGFLLVWADNESEQNDIDASALHVNFALSKGGESIAMTASDGTTIDSVMFGAQLSDASEGRIPDGGSVIGPQAAATPGASNQPANSAPVLAAIPDMHCLPGEYLLFTAQASDAESAYQNLTFSLDPGAPAGSGITANGNFFWDLPPAVTPGSFPITIRVTDDGIPVLDDSDSFMLYVHPLPALDPILSVGGGDLTMTAATAPGHNYQLQYKSSLTDPTWLPLGSAVVGDGTSMEWQTSVTNTPYRFFRLFIDLQ